MYIDHDQICHNFATSTSYNRRILFKNVDRRLQRLRNFEMFVWVAASLNEVAFAEMPDNRVLTSSKIKINRFPEAKVKRKGKETEGREKCHFWILRKNMQQLSKIFFRKKYLPFMGSRKRRNFFFSCLISQSMLFF